MCLCYHNVLEEIYSVYCIIHALYTQTHTHTRTYTITYTDKYALSIVSSCQIKGKTYMKGISRVFHQVYALSVRPQKEKLDHHFQYHFITHTVQRRGSEQSCFKKWILMGPGYNNCPMGRCCNKYGQCPYFVQKDLLIDLY